MVALGVFTGLVVAISIARHGLSQRWPIRRLVGTAGMSAVAIVVASATLAPSDSLGDAPGCLVGPPGEIVGWMADDQRMLNVLMFFPMGLLAMLAASNAQSRALLVSSLLVAPFLIEAAQNTTVVGRLCDLHDIMDNWFGSLFGVFVGVLLAASFGRKGAAAQNP